MESGNRSRDGVTSPQVGVAFGAVWGSVAMAPRCRNCGAEVSMWLSRCNNCGAPITEAISEATQERKDASPQVEVSPKHELAGSAQPAERGRFCSQCGHKLRPEDKYCSECGTSAVGVAAPLEAGRTAEET